MKETCNRMETGSCTGCNVVSLLWKNAATKDEVDQKAQDISDRYCPTESGGIDAQTKAIVYNHRPNA